jgi:glutathione S-transferase
MLGRPRCFARRSDNGHRKNRPYLAGDSLTLADITAGTNLYRYFELDIKRPRMPNVEAWYERLKHPAAYREYVTIPFDELRG